MDKLDDVWTTRDYPVLCDVARRIDQGAGLVDAHEVAQTLAMDVEQVIQAMTALQRRGFVHGEGDLSIVGINVVTRLDGSAYLITGLHPDGDDALSRLITGLRQAADQTTDEDERSRLRRAADALGGIARDIGVGVMTAVITQQAG